MSSPYAWRITMEYSAPWDTTSGRYYWTNSYYWEDDGPFWFSSGYWSTLRGVLNNSASEACVLERYRIESAFGTGTHSHDSLDGRAGFLSGDDRCLLPDAVRLAARAGGAGKWYKTLRGMLGPADVEGGVVGDEIMSWLDAVILPRLAEVPLVNSVREPVGTITINPSVRPWQLRHGTKRAARRVLLPYI